MKGHIHSSQLIGRYTMLDPLDESLELVNRLWARTCTAVADSRSLKVAVKVLHIVDLLCDPLIVVLGAVGEDHLIGQTVPSDQLAIASFEQRQVGVRGSHDAGVLVT